MEGVVFLSTLVGGHPAQVGHYREIERQDFRLGVGVSVGATCLIPTGNGRRPS